MLALNSRKSFRLLRVTPEGNKGEVNLVNRVVSGHSRRTYERRDQTSTYDNDVSTRKGFFKAVLDGFIAFNDLMNRWSTRVDFTIRWLRSHSLA